MRGAAFVSFFEGLSELRGELAAARVREALPGHLRVALEGGAVSRVGWYPLKDYVAVHDACERTLGGGETLAFQLGRVTTDRDTRGLIRYVLALTSPDLLVRHADKVFGSYVRGPTMEVERVTGSHRFVVRWHKFYGTTPLFEAEWRGGITLLLEKAGAQGVEVVRRPELRPGDVTFEVNWA